MRVNNLWSLLLCLSSSLLVSCGEEPSPSSPLEQIPKSSDNLASTAYVTDQTPRPQMAFSEIMEALTDPQQSDGTLLVGLKEQQAVRGVSTDGIALPIPARFAAAESIMKSFPSLELVDGIERRFTIRRDSREDVQSLIRTFIRVRVPEKLYTDTFLSTLRDHPHVDYIAPNYWNGVTSSIRTDTRIVAQSSDFQHWGLDSIRAPGAWSLGYTGDDVHIGMADTGFDFVGFSNHPDIWTDWAFTNFVDENVDNTCTDTTGSQACYWEEPFHGTGVLGSAVARDNNTGGVGAAPGEDFQYIAKPFYLGPGNKLPESDFADAVLWVSSPIHQVQVAVTSIGYQTTSANNYPTLQDAFATAYNQYDVLWFAAAGNSGSIVNVPARFDEVVAVGGVEQDLTKASFSASDPLIELVAPAVDLRISWNRLDDDPSYLYTAEKTGTSLAAPLAAAVARIALEANPSWDASTLRSELQQHARDLGSSGRDNDYGYGLVDAVCIIQQQDPCSP